jgi:hypothetical protein
MTTLAKIFHGFLYSLLTNDKVGPCKVMITAYPIFSSSYEVLSKLEIAMKNNIVANISD